MIGDCVRFARWDRRMTQKELAKRAGLNVWTISMIEKGTQHPKDETLEANAEALELPVSSLTMYGGD